MKFIDDVFGPEDDGPPQERKLGLVVGGMLDRESFEKKFVGKRGDENLAPVTFEVFNEVTGQWEEIEGDTPL